MPSPENTFKSAMAARQQQIGCWLSFADIGAAELMATAGFDWLVIDGEHAPNDIRSIRDQLIAVQGRGTQAIVRVPVGEAWVIKQVLDAGAQTVLVPMVDTADQARALVAATRYAPQGIRGMGAMGGRVSQFGAIADYVQTANDQISLLVQAESRAALNNLDAILAVDGVDGVFIGPADLSADMGFPGNAAAPEVRAAIADAIARITGAGKAAGLLTFSPQEAKTYLDMGVNFLAVGLDTLILARAARALAAETRALIKR